MSDGNAAIARRYFEEVLGGHLDVADEIIAEEVAFYGPAYGSPPISGLNEFKGFVTYLRSAFPDIHFTPEEEIVAGDRVTGRFMMHGTHQGEWFGIAPTGKQWTMSGVDLFRVNGGKIAEIRVFYDTFGFVQQLGAVPAPAQVEGGSSA
jgi:steroid delta-isomerase-like uncharacterized protein